MTNRTSRKPTFYDMLGHELRGPLFPIMALTDLLLEEDFATANPEDIREQLSLIASSAKGPSTATALITGASAGVPASQARRLSISLRVSSTFSMS